MIERVTEKDKATLEKLFIENWQSSFMVSGGKVKHLHALEAFVYKENDEIVGIVTFCIENNAIEIVSLDSSYENKGVGTLLLQAVIDFYKTTACSRLWLITTNDNLSALGFYQKRNFTMHQLHLNAVKEARKLKPSIPEIGYHQIPIQHELELQYAL